MAAETRSLASEEARAAIGTGMLLARSTPLHDSGRNIANAPTNTK